MTVREKIIAGFTAAGLAATMATGAEACVGRPGEHEALVAEVAKKNKEAGYEKYEIRRVGPVSRSIKPSCSGMGIAEKETSSPPVSAEKADGRR